MGWGGEGGGDLDGQVGEGVVEVVEELLALRRRDAVSCAQKQTLPHTHTRMHAVAKGVHTHTRMSP
jgi:hypothetical protein